MSTSSEYGERRKAERQARERLFRKSRPHLRPFDMGKDMWVLWAAYDLGSFPNLPKGMEPSAFTQFVRDTLARRSSALVVEDDCRWFKTGRGPVCLVLIDNYGWQIEPFVDYFKWATPRIVLRASVAFFQKIRYDAQIGVCLVKTPEKFSNLFNSLKNYGVLNSCGKVPEGYPGADQFLFQVRGKRGINVGAHGVGPASEVQRSDRVQRPESAREERDGPSGPAAVHGEQGRQEAAVAVEPGGGDDQQRESDPPAVAPVTGEMRQARIRDWA